MSMASYSLTELKGNIKVYRPFCVRSNRFRLKSDICCSVSLTTFFSYYFWSTLDYLRFISSSSEADLFGFKSLIMPGILLRFLGTVGTSFCSPSFIVCYYSFADRSFLGTKLTMELMPLYFVLLILLSSSRSPPSLK